MELHGLNAPFEVIVVDDGSTDGSLEVLRSLQATRPWLRVFQHRRNFGQSACYCTGFKLAHGELVITMDADRQHDPADIKPMLRALQGEVAAVCGVRAGRKDTWVRRLSSRVANGFASWAIGDPVVDAGCTFRIIRRTAVAELPVFNGQHRFLPTLLRYQGYQIARLNINHRDRPAGISKYGIGNRLWRGLVDCLGVRWYHKRCLPANRLPALHDNLPVAGGSTVNSRAN
jgi:dolichol-phosphate mannosyltransferase